MPAIIPFIPAILGAAEVIAATTAAWLSIGAAFAVGIYERERAKDKARDARNAYNASLQDRIVTIRSAVSAREYVLGTVRKGGTLMYAETVGTDKTSLDSVTALACNQTEVVGYYIGDQFMTPQVFPGDKYGTVESQSISDTFTLPTSGSTSQSLTVTLSFIPTGTVDLFFQIGRTRARANVISVVGTVVTFNGVSTSGPTTGIFAHYQAASGVKLKLQFKNGSSDQETENWSLVATPQWTSEHRLRGVTYIRTLMVWDESLYANGAPPISAVLRGLAIDGHPFYDPRTTTNPVYTDNPALLSAWFMMLPRRLGGCGIPSSWINWTWVSAAANVCDELIEVRGVRPGDPPQMIKRYQCHTVISTANDPLRNLQQILSAMNGRYAFTAGEYRIAAGAFRSATRTLSIDDICGDEELQVIPVGSDDDPPNVVTAQFADALKNWAETSPPAVRNPDYIQADGGEVPLDIKLPATTDARQANYLQGVLLESKRPAFGLSVPIGGVGEDIGIFDCVQIDLPDRPAYAGKTYEVLSIVDFWNGKFRLTLAEIRPQTWELDANRFTPRNPIVPPDLSYLWHVEPIAGLSAEIGEPQTLPDGNAVAQIILTWAQPIALYVGSGGRIEIRYGEAGGEWIGVAPVPGDSTGTTISASLVEGSNYQFQVRVINSIGAASRWTGVWVQIEGTELAVGVQGPGLFTWANLLNVSTTSSSITKTGGSAAWDAGAHSLQSYTGGCFASARCGALGSRRMIALNGDPAIDAGMTGLDFALHTTLGNVLQVYESGILTSSHGAVTADTLIAIKYDNSSVTYEKDGAVIRAVTIGAGRRFFLDTSLFDISGRLVDIAFGPMGGIGPQGLPGVVAQSVRLSATAQAFTFDSTGASAPAGQSVAFTAVRQNIATATVWSAIGPDGLPVTLTGTGDTRALSVVNFGARSWARVRAESGGFFDEITVVRLVQGANGANAVQAFLTNENHTLAANPDGVVGSYANANGQLFVYEGTTDRTSVATLSIVSTSGCTVELNTATNSPIAGQPKGFYRATAVTADQAVAVIRAAYGTFTADLRFTLTRARQGQPGDGQNMLPIGQWAVGTTGSQGNGFWIANGLATENRIVLGGAGTAPVGPYGTSTPLWECQSLDATGSTGDGGWTTNDIAVDHRRTYRSTVWFQFNQASGHFYHGCRPARRMDGTLEDNPYFHGDTLASMVATGVRPNKWYLSVGIIHGSGFTGQHSGVAGIYDPESGRRVAFSNEFKQIVGANAQLHRAYHFYDTSTTTRQWMPEPRFEELNGSEPTVDSLLGLHRSVPWIARGQCFAGLTSFHKVGGVNGWDSDVSSVVSYDTFHLQFKAGQTNMNRMVGVTTDPLANQSHETIDLALYPHAGAVLQIYENGILVGDFGAYTTDTEFAITGDGLNIRYFKDRTIIRTVPIAGGRFYVDSSFYEPGSSVGSLKWGPGVEFENLGAGDFPAGALTSHYYSSLAGPVFESTFGFARSVNVHSLSFTPRVDGYALVTMNAVVTGTNSCSVSVRKLQGTESDVSMVTGITGLTNFPLSKTAVIPVLGGVPVTLYINLKLTLGTGPSSVTISNMELIVDYYAR